ncbi:exported hypothetical protein [Candidatus Sulfopaludibacter sp. SbA3]|nr:exported hypothetical protein [Candidatus Sulfopaludibacter sp. SbA3]
MLPFPRRHPCSLPLTASSCRALPPDSSRGCARPVAGMQIEEPTFHFIFMANTFGKEHNEVSSWWTPSTAKCRASTTWKSGSTHAGASQHAARDGGHQLRQLRRDLHGTLPRRRVDPGDERPHLELFGPLKHDLKKKIAIGAVSHRVLQADRPEDVAGEIRRALQYIPAGRLIVYSDCEFGRQGCNREITFYKARAIAQGCNIVPGTRTAGNAGPRRRSQTADRRRARPRLRERTRCPGVLPSVTLESHG